MTLPALKSLERRLVEAKGPDREIDCLVWAAVNGCGQPVITVGPPTYSPPRYFCNPNPETHWIGYDLLNVAPHHVVRALIAQAEEKDNGNC